MDKTESPSFKIPDNATVGFLKQLDGFKNIGKELGEAIKKQVEGMEKAAKVLGEAMKKYAEQLPPSLTKMAEHGWYICGSSAMSDGIDLAIELKKGNIEKVDKYLVDFYEGEFKSLVNNIKRAYPERIKIMNEAQRAHKSRMYFASTSLFLSTADGIFNGQLFRTQKGKKHLKKQLKNTKHLGEFGELLTRISAIDAGYEDIKLFKSSLNRHGVMHGLDFEYGTKINSLKSLSLLAFICDFFDQKDRLPILKP